MRIYFLSIKLSFNKSSYQIKTKKAPLLCEKLGPILASLARVGDPQPPLAACQTEKSVALPAGHLRN